MCSKKESIKLIIGIQNFLNNQIFFNRVNGLIGTTVTVYTAEVLAIFDDGNYY